MVDARVIYVGIFLVRFRAFGDASDLIRNAHVFFVYFCEQR